MLYDAIPSPGKGSEIAPGSITDMYRIPLRRLPVFGSPEIQLAQQGGLRGNIFIIKIYRLVGDIIFFK